MVAFDMTDKQFVYKLIIRYKFKLFSFHKPHFKICVGVHNIHQFPGLLRGNVRTASSKTHSYFFSQLHHDGYNALALLMEKMLLSSQKVGIMLS